MNREMRLAQQRLEALLIYYKKQGIDYIDGYTLNNIQYTFNPDVINGYFNNKNLAKVLLNTKKGVDKLSINRELTDRYTKFRYIIYLFKKVVEAKDLNFQQQMLKTFGVKYKLNKDDDLLAAELYLICKTINIAQKYPTYEEEKEDILLEDNETFDYLEILNPTPYPEYIDRMKAVAEKVKKQGGHIGLKAHRAIKFIRQSQRKGKMSKRQVNLGESFDLWDYENSYWKNERLNSVEKITEVLPPSIFSYEIILEKTTVKEETADDGEDAHIGHIEHVRSHDNSMLLGVEVHALNHIALIIIITTHLRADAAELDATRDGLLGIEVAAEGIQLRV